MPQSIIAQMTEMLDQIHDAKDTDPRKARYLRDRLYAFALTEIASDAGSPASRDKMQTYARTALNAEKIEISPIPRAKGSVHPGSR